MLADKKRTKVGLRPKQGRLQNPEHFLLILRQPSLDIDIIGVVIAGDSSGCRNSCQQSHGLPDDFVRGEHPETAVQDFGQQWGLDLGDKGAEPQKIRPDGIYGSGGRRRMLKATFLAAYPQHDILADLNAGLPQHPAGGYLPLPTAAFANSGQDLIVPAFQTYVNPAQSCLGQQTQIRQTFLPDILGRAIDRKPLQAGEQAVTVAADFR